MGRALAERWAQEGALICIVDVNDARGEETVNELKKSASEVLYYHCDITNQQEIEQVRDNLINEWDGVDIVVNNAGVATGGALQDESLEQWQWVFDINLFGAVRFTQVFTPVFQKQGHGYFLNVASQAGVTPMPLMGSYCAVKAALVSFSESMRLELIDDNIGVSVLCPAFFKTNLSESMRSGNPAMKAVVNKLLERSSITAKDVADKAFKAVQAGKFMIQTHSEGKQVFRLKRLLPQKWYLRMMARQTKKFRSKGKGSVKEAAKAGGKG